MYFYIIHDFLYVSYRDSPHDLGGRVEYLVSPRRPALLSRRSKSNNNSVPNTDIVGYKVGKLESDVWQR